jgi:hypothetical protein
MLTKSLSTDLQLSTRASHALKRVDRRMNVHSRINKERDNLHVRSDAHQLSLAGSLKKVGGNSESEGRARKKRILAAFADWTATCPDGSARRLLVGANLEVTPLWRR